MAAVNVVTGLLQVIAWRKRASNIRVSVRSIDIRVLKIVVRYCSLQSILTAAMLCIAGLDITIVAITTTSKLVILLHRQWRRVLYCSSSHPW